MTSSSGSLAIAIIPKCVSHAGAILFHIL